jgi:hypothetical protein
MAVDPAPEPRAFRRPGVLVALAVLDFLAAVIALAPAAAAAGAFSRQHPSAPLLAAAGLAALLSGLAVVAGVGLLQLEAYGLRTQVALSALGLPLVPVGTLIAALLLAYLRKPATRALFSPRGEKPARDAGEAPRASDGEGLALAAVVIGLVLAGMLLLALVGTFLVRLLAVWPIAGPGALA